MDRTSDHHARTVLAERPEALPRAELLHHIEHCERRLLGGIGTHAEMLALTDAEEELVRREEARNRRQDAAERRTRASRRSSGEALLSF